jgi:hypothetical protein
MSGYRAELMVCPLVETKYVLTEERWTCYIHVMELRALLILILFIVGVRSRLKLGRHTFVRKILQ